MNEKKDTEQMPVEELHDGKQDQPEDNNFPLGKACDLSGEGECESCT